jgi:biopolymer transport protein ExbB/biopolymer transport protein TolQ
MNIVEQLMHVALLGSAWVLYLLLFLSVVSFAAMLDRFLFFRRNGRGAKGLRADLDRALAAREQAALEAALAKHACVEADVLRAALKFRDGGPEAIVEAVEAELERARPRLERNMTLLGTLGNNAPFVGLFGTVIGVVEAFHHLGAGAGASGGMDNVMAGIAEALIATGVGIFVAIPAVVGFNAGQKRVTAIEGETVALGRLVSAWLRTAPVEHSSFASEASSPAAASTAVPAPERLRRVALDGGR